MNTEEKTEYLATFMSDARIARINEVLELRTRYITTVLEDIYHPPNASATLRSSECFGIQDVHIIENDKKYRPSADVVRGASKWMTFHRYRKENDKHPSVICISELKRAGYKIAITTPDNTHSITPEEIPLDAPVAICFGTEETGVSDIMKDAADFHITVPMYGFTESFNISVAAALIIRTVSERVRNSQINWQLSEKEKEELRFEWYRKSVKNSDKLLKLKESVE